MKGSPISSSQSSQRGIVSIMVTLVLMIVITLIVLGFAQLSRREQRQSLDRQLSTQAFLAAESGINDARQAIFKRLAAGGTIDEKTVCETPDSGSTMYDFDPTISTDNNVAYSCLLVDKTLKDITQSIPANGKSVTIPLNPVGGIIDTLHINWTLPTKPASVSDCAASVVQGDSFNPAAGSNAWKCPYGVLRVDIVPTDATNLKRSLLNANQKAIFLYPTRSGTMTPVDYGAAGTKGAVAPMSCTVNGCRVDIKNLAGGTRYGMRLSAVYASGTFVLSAEGGGVSRELEGAQVQVDATGRAQDVLRRMQVRFSIVPGGSTNNGEFALQSAGPICKRFDVIRDTGTFINMPGSVANIAGMATNPMCVAGTENAPPPPPAPACPATLSHDFGFALGTNYPYHLVSHGWTDSTTGKYYPPNDQYSIGLAQIPGLSNISPGCNYRVTIQGADDSHPHNPPSEQPNERFGAFFYKSGVQVAPKTIMTDDFPDVVKIGQAKTTENICFSTAPDTVTFKIYNLITGDYSNFNSVQVMKINMELTGSCTP